MRIWTGPHSIPVEKLMAEGKLFEAHPLKRTADQMLVYVGGAKIGYILFEMY